MSANSNDKIVKFCVFEEKEDDEVNAKTFEIHASNIPEESFLASLVRRVGEKTTGTRVNAKGEILVKHNVNIFSVIADYLEDKPIIYEIDANIRAAFDYFGIKFRDYPSEFLTIKRREDRFRSGFGTDPKLSNDPYYGLIELTFERYKEIVQSKHEVRSENANQLISDIDRKIGKNVPIFNYGNAKKNDQKQGLVKRLDNPMILDTYDIVFGTKSNVKVAMRGQNHGKKPNEEVKTISLTNVCNYGWGGVRCINQTYVGGANDVAIIPDASFCLSHTIMMRSGQGITEPCSKHIPSGMFCHVPSNDMTLCPKHFSEEIKKGEFPPLPEGLALDNDYFKIDEIEDSSDNEDDNVSNNNNNNNNIDQDSELRAEYDLLIANLKNLTCGIEAELVGNGGDFLVAGGSIISIIFGSRISDIDLFYCGAGRDQGNDDNFIEKMTSIMYKKSFAAYPDIDSRVMITRTENSVTCKLEVTLDEQIYDSHLKENGGNSVSIHSERVQDTFRSSSWF
jgi:hypothetical protein